ncbi:hypothetical protein F5Y16DRAFT_395900 [Xylariaceae sp. FL0255]|nr:hypothetical protein F5Y16DRAFT_395900 [Xylariaceae sp. FL0255]
MSRMSRGCLRCRQRRVKCGQEKPVCLRCVKRGEVSAMQVCEGYRDEASIIFRHETSKTINLAAVSSSSSSSRSGSSPRRQRSRSVERFTSFQEPLSVPDPSDLDADEAFGVKVPGRLAWLKSPPIDAKKSIQQDSVDHFLEKYVIHPCNESSSPGFLEYLPSMFKEAQVVGRNALRWAVQAGAYADLSISEKSDVLSRKAWQCYGASLAALNRSLAEPGKEPDDYDLMTIVMLDIFETFHIHDPCSRGMHAQAQESEDWLAELNEEMSFVKLEKDAVRATEIRERARDLRTSLTSGQLPIQQVFDIAVEMLALDAEVDSWRQKPIWAYKTLNVSDLPPFDPSVEPMTPTIELHSDLWLMYEWNYHRTARLLVQEQVLKCVNSALASPDIVYVGESVMIALAELSQQLSATIRTLAEQILSTVPQSFGDITSSGQVHDHSKGPPRCQWIGAYFQLWPMKIIGGESISTDPYQKRLGKIAFERIREYTGMKSHLGDKSKII